MAEEKKKKKKVKPFLIYPDPLLKRVALPVDFEKESLDDLLAIVTEMSDSLGATGWGAKLGIAATQIGILKRIIAVKGVIMINPKWKGAEQPIRVVEMCYSVPGKKYSVWRDKYGWASWYNITGDKHEVKLNGDEAIIFQHELDHLNGDCCCDVGELIEEPSRTPEETDSNK